MSYTFQADVTANTVVSECAHKPSILTKKDAFWLWAKNNKYSHGNIEMSKIGKWMIFPSRDIVDDVWDQGKEGIKLGKLWDAKVSTRDHNKPNNHTHVVIIYTKNFEDVEDVISVLDYLETSGIKPEEQKIYYKTDQMTYSGVYANRPGQKRQKASIYDSVSIRKNSVIHPVEETEESPKPKEKKQKTFDELTDFFIGQSQK